MSEEGFIRLSRKVFHNFLWKEDREKSRWEAWVDLIQSAAYAPSRVLVQGRRLSLRRGELVASVRFLGERWRWDKSKVLRFLHLLKEEAMIETHNESGIGVILLCKFEEYNSTHDQNGTMSETLTRHPRDTDETKERRKEDQEYSQSPREDFDHPPGWEPTIEMFVAECLRSSIPKWFAEKKWEVFSAKGWAIGLTPTKWKKTIPLVHRDFVNAGSPPTEAAAAPRTGKSNRSPAEAPIHDPKDNRL